MMWVLLALTVAILAGLLIWRGRIPRAGYELTGAALLIGLSGYALQGAPSYEGAPKDPVENAETADRALVEARQSMGDKFSSGAAWLTLADGMTSQGQYGSAATVLRKAVRQYPNDPDLWVALGNALIGHSDGMISPAAQFALQKAANIAPDHPGPPFFMGLSLAQSGRLDEARALWAELLERTPADAPWRADLESRIARVNAMIASQPPVQPQPGVQQNPAGQP